MDYQKARRQNEVDLLSKVFYSTLIDIVMIRPMYGRADST